MYNFLNSIENGYKIYFILIFIFIVFLILFFLIKLFVKFGNILFSYIYRGNKKIFSKLKKNKNLIKINNKYPNSSFFIKNRFDKNHFFGLPFTILIVLFLYIFTEFIGLTDSVLDGELITKIDIRLSDFFYYFKDKRLIDFFLFISYFGNIVIVLFLTTITTIILFIRGKIIEIIGFLFSIGITSFIAFLSKLIIARPRPELAVYRENSYSFPSFHATISIALYGFIIWLFIVKIKKWKYKLYLTIVGIIIAFIIGFSRLYLNVHYLSDVISGWFLGFLGLTFGITIIGYFKHINKFYINNKIYLYKYRKIITYLLLIFTIIFTIFYYNIYYNKIIFLGDKKEKYENIIDLKDILDKKPHLKYTETVTGRETVPINFIFIGKRNVDILNFFIKSSWEQADKIGRTSLKKIGGALIENKKYETAPMTPLYWNKKIQIYGFQQLTEKKDLKYRHHIRIWKTNYKLLNNYVYVASGIFDNGLKWGITHKISPDIDKEREFIFNTFNKSNIDFQLINLGVRKIGTNFSGDNFFTDGNAYIIKLK